MIAYFWFSNLFFSWYLHRRMLPCWILLSQSCVISSSNTKTNDAKSKLCRSAKYCLRDGIVWRASVRRIVRVFRCLSRSVQKNDMPVYITADAIMHSVHIARTTFCCSISKKRHWYATSSMVCVVFMNVCRWRRTTVTQRLPTRVSIWTLFALIVNTLSSNQAKRRKERYINKKRLFFFSNIVCFVFLLQCKSMVPSNREIHD